MNVAAWIWLIILSIVVIWLVSRTHGMILVIVHDHDKILQLERRIAGKKTRTPAKKVINKKGKR